MFDKNVSGFVVKKDSLGNNKDLNLSVTEKGSCKKGHPVTSVMKDIRIDTGSGTRIESVQTHYCRICRKYYIDVKTNSRLKKIGKPMCTVEGGSSYGARRDNDYYMPEYENRQGNWETRSVLNKLGYNVNQNDDLSDNERQCILIEAMENRNVSKRRLIRFLEWLVEENGNYRKMELAVSKWKRDIEFVKAYTLKKRP